MDNFFQAIEIVAALLVLLNVFLLTRESIWAWPIGLVAVLLYLYIFLHSRLYSDSILQVIYAALNIFGWWFWSRGKVNSGELQVSRLGNGSLLCWAGIAIVGTICWGYFMRQNTDADFAYADAFTTVASLIAQYLLARKKLENWFIWIIVDVVAIYIYLQKGLNVTSVLYFLLMLLCIKGIRDWRKSMSQNPVREFL